MYAHNKETNSATKTVIAAFISSIGLVGCGGGGGSAPPAITNTLDTEIRSVLVAESTSLTAPRLLLEADDTGGIPVSTYLWTQTAGPELTDLAGTDTESISFTTPSTVQTLRFEVEAVSYTHLTLPTKA